MARDQEAALRAEFDDIMAQAAEPDEHVAEAVARCVRDLEDSLAAQALWRLAPGVAALGARCAAAGADHESRPAALAAGTAMFAVPSADPLLLGLAVQRGGERFVTFVRHHADGRVAGVWVARWKPDLAAALAAVPEPPPDDPRARVRFAEELAGYAGAGSVFHLDDLTAQMAPDGHLDDAVRVASLTAADVDRPGRQSTILRGRGGPALLRYAAAMAPALAAAPAPVRPDPFLGSPAADGRRLRWFSTMADLTAELLALDGGYPGRVCADVARRWNAQAVRAIAAQHGPDLARNHDDLVALGYVWGAKRLSYGDTDRRCFAIPTGDSRVAAVAHENIDLCADIRRFLIVLHRGDDGAAERLEAHFIHDPAGAVAHRGLSLVEVADAIRCFENTEASPPRLSQAEFARRLQAGEPLPPPAVGIDLATSHLTGHLTCADAPEARDLGFHLGAMIASDRWILDKLTAGHWPEGGGTEETTDFGDEEYDGAAVGLAPGRR